MKKITKTLWFPALTTVVGVLLGFAIWLTIYLAHRTPAIAFDGPAIAGMLLGMFSGGLLLGLVGASLYVDASRTRKRVISALLIVSVAGFVSCIIVGVVALEWHQHTACHGSSLKQSCLIKI